jgi:hypothetical protein
MHPHNPTTRLASAFSHSLGPMLTMKYKDGEKKIVVPNNATIVQFVNAEKADLKPGAKVFIGAATKKPDGSLETAGINVGKDGITPPM